MGLSVSIVAQVGPSRESIEDALGVLQAGIEYAGTVAFAVSAALLAGRRQMNIVGVVVFGVLVAVGGGTMRDVLLGDLPVYWIDEPMPLFVAAVAAAATILLSRTGTLSLVRRYHLVRVSDSAGLAMFTILGTNIALDSGAGTVSAVVVGVIAGAGGGILRDNLAGRIPEVLASGSLYATAAILGSAINIALLETSLWSPVASTIAVVFIFAIRLLSIHFHWGVPRFAVDQNDDGD